MTFLSTKANDLQQISNSTGSRKLSGDDPVPIGLLRALPKSVIGSVKDIAMFMRQKLARGAVLSERRGVMFRQAKLFYVGDSSKLRRPVLKLIQKFISRKGWFALCVAGRLCLLPILFRIYTLSALLRRLTPASGREKKDTALELEDAVQIVVRICNLRLFRSRMFPRLCLRQSLTLYRTLTRLGYPCEIHFGIQKERTDLFGHSWVTMRGRSVADTAHGDMYKVVYSYASDPLLECRDESGIERPGNRPMFNEV